MHFAIPLPDRWRQMDPRVFMASWMKDFVSEKQSKQCPGEQYPILMSGFYIWAPAQTSTQIYMHTAHAHTHMERQDEIRRTWIIKIRSSKSPSSNSHITYHISFQSPLLLPTSQNIILAKKLQNKCPCEPTNMSRLASPVCKESKSFQSR